MGTGKWRADWKKGCWLVWRIDPTELNRQVVEYATLRPLESVRGVVLLLLVLIAITAAALSGEAFRQGHDTVGYLRLATCVAFSVLGMCLYRGKQWAAIVLMVCITVEWICKSTLAYLYSSDYRSHATFLLAEGVLAWAFWMHALYVAYRIEEQRTGKRATPLSELAGFTPAGS